jgi:hypothetical protein
LRGVASPVWVETQKRYLFFLTIYSNDENEKMRFDFVDVTNGNVIASDRSLFFSDNRLIGAPASPFAIDVAESKTCLDSDPSIHNNSQPLAFEIYPNPFTDMFHIHFAVATDAVIKIMDPIGQVVYSREVSKATQVDISPEASGVKLANGIYFVKVTAAGQTSIYKISKNN